MSGNPRAARDGAERARRWAATMAGERSGGVVRAHADDPGVRVGRPGPSSGPPGAPLDAHAPAGPAPRPVRGGPALPVLREDREAAEETSLSRGATRASGAGARAEPEAPDELRTCFERDRDRILHSTPFRRLAGKTQVFVFPRDHQRTRLTHALEVAQVATAVARATGLNVALTEAIALGHDCGHGPGGHASEDAFAPFLPGGYDHAVWGADVVAAPLNLCAETLDGIRHHSWSLPSPSTPEGLVVSWADRCAYCAHDLEDAAGAGIVDLDELPNEVTETAGRSRAAQLRYFITALVECIADTGQVGMRPEPAETLAALRRFNYERIYTQPASLAQGEAVVAVLRALVSWYAEDLRRLPDPDPQPGASPARPATPTGAAADPTDGAEDAVRRAVTYVGGMTDRFAFETAVARLGWERHRLPRGIDLHG
jgi:dGTPase